MEKKTANQCEKCGAPLRGRACRYCGTEYTIFAFERGWRSETDTDRQMLMGGTLLPGYLFAGPCDCEEDCEARQYEVSVQ